MTRPAFDLNLPHPENHDLSKNCLLRLLREKKNMSRQELSRLTRLSVYQVEGLEGESAQNMMSRFISCTRALGYRLEDVWSMISQPHSQELIKIRGSLSKPICETAYEEGVKLTTFFKSPQGFLGQIHLPPGKQLELTDAIPGDCLTVFVREGTLILEQIVQQMVFKKDSFFVLPHGASIHLSNVTGFVPTTALLFSFRG